jgi:hypothetical protein
MLGAAKIFGPMETQDRDPWAVAHAQSLGARTAGCGRGLDLDLDLDHVELKPMSKLPSATGGHPTS